MTLGQFMRNVNFDELAKQKEELLAVIEIADRLGLDEEKLEGILYLVDLIQDTAVDILGYSEDEVFNFKEG